MFEDEAEEEDEEEGDGLKGLEDFGFGVVKPTGASGGKEDEDEKVTVREDDFENIVDELSDNEGDDEAGEEFRAQQVRPILKYYERIMRMINNGIM